MKQKRDNTNAIFFRIDTEMKQKLAKIAKADRRTVSNLIRIMIENKLKEYEDETEEEK